MRLHARRGAALAIAIFALVAIAALVHATVAPAVAHRRTASRLAAYQRAESGAEGAIAAVLRDWPPDRWRAMPVGASAEVTHDVEALPGGGPEGSSMDLRVTRLSPAVFVLHARATVHAAGVPAVARRVLFLELRTDPVAHVPALTLGGDLSAGASDVIEIDAGCRPDSAPVPAVMVAPWSRVGWPGAVEGAVTRDSAAGEAEAYARAAGIDIAALRERADVRLAAGAVVSPAPVEADGRCASSDRHWGEPLRGEVGTVAGCTASFPIVVAEGDLALSGGRGQGLLLVDGRLRITGPALFAGLVVALGGIATDGGDVTVRGSVYAGPDAAVTLGAVRSAIRGSSCLLQDAASTQSRLVPIGLRAWGR